MLQTPVLNNGIYVSIYRESEIRDKKLILICIYGKLEKSIHVSFFG